MKGKEQSGGRTDQVQKKVEKWAKVTPPALVMLAREAVEAADDLFTALRSIRSRKGFFITLAPPPVPVWMRLYKQHRRLETILGNYLGLDILAGKSASLVMGEVRSLSRMNPAELQSLVEAMSQKDWQKALAMGGDFLSQMQEAERHLDDLMPKLMAEPEMQFFLRVWFPCWMEYRLYPPELYRLARNGDLDAIEDLLRLDKSVVFDRRIAEQIHQAYHGPNKAVFWRLAGAISGRPRGGISKQSVKCAIAGMISNMAQRMRQPMTEPEIRAVFDAHARTKGKLRDTDLQASPDAFAKAIQRNRKKWNKNHLDKNHP